MNVKIIAVIVVALLAVAGVTTFVVLSQNKDTASYDSAAFEVVSRVNSEGSGLYIDKTVANTVDGKLVRTSNGTAFFGENYSLSDANKAAWGGLILGDPGSKSIQHTQLASIANKVGLEFKQYTTTMGEPSANVLYYVTNLATYETIVGDPDIKGGIVWEPQFQKVIQRSSDKYMTLALTNDIFPDHACCIVAMNHNWLQDNSAVAVKFLAGYTKAVDFINAAKKDKTGADYTWLVDFAKSTSSSSALTTEEVEDAIDNITYLYADKDDGSLGDLTNGIATLSTDLKALGAITSDKFNDGNKFAKAFVNDSYLKDAVAGKASKTGTDSVSVCVINGDIHQLAIHVAKEKGYFSEYGLNVTVDKVLNGNEVAGLLVSKDYMIGFLGAPPATILTVDGEHIIV